MHLNVMILDSNGYITEGKITKININLNSIIILDEIEPVLRGMYALLGIKHVQDYPPKWLQKI